MDSTWTIFEQNSWFPWTSAVLGSLIVGLSGVVPLILIPTNTKSKENSQAKRNLHRQLSFAIGGLLGDVFLHLIPEAYSSGKKFSEKLKIKAADFNLFQLDSLDQLTKIEYNQYFLINRLIPWRNLLNFSNLW